MCYLIAYTGICTDKDKLHNTLTDLVFHQLSDFTHYLKQQLSSRSSLNVVYLLVNLIWKPPVGSLNSLFLNGG